MSEERSIDGPRIERAVREILLAIGEDPGREGLVETPERVAEAYTHLFSGLDKDPTSYLEVSFAADSHDAVLLRELPLASITCSPLWAGPTSRTFQRSASLGSRR